MLGPCLLLNGLFFVGQRYSLTALLIDPRELAVINIFTGGLGAAVALIAIGRGGMATPVDTASVTLGGQILFFAFTYLWVAINQLTGVEGRGLGWYSLFVAITALPAGWLQLVKAGSDPWLIWLGCNWLGWALLWFMFFLLMGLQRKITGVTGIASILAGVFTGWVPAYLVFESYLKISGKS